MPGPLPKRIEERRRRNAVPGETVVSIEGAVVVPELPRSPAPHPVARAWYEALAASGQSAYYEPSDWAAAVFVAMAMTKCLRAKRFSADLFAQVWRAMDDLLTTEKERRRVRLQVQRVLDGATPEDAPQPTVLDDYKRRIANG